MFGAIRKDSLFFMPPYSQSNTVFFNLLYSNQTIKKKSA